ncbi:MAG: FAD-dependent oxidoreductase [Brachybacterium sp.]|nr:FAD-dependent oxidoreductase [Brachybacterium sp.]
MIGAGVVGAALADELVQRGCTEVTLIDQGELFVTGGSSSHAPGFVFQTGPSRVMTELAKRTLAKLDDLDLDGAPLQKRVGGLEVARTEGQLAELRRRLGFATAWGIPAELLSPDQVRELWPDMATDLILGALHTPTDAVVYSKRAVEAQARRAEDGGATLLGLTRATGIDTEDGRVTGVRIEDAATGENQRVLPADAVIACGGIWGPQLGPMIGVRVPMHPMEHCFGWTDPLPELAGRDLAADEPERPIIRHQGAGLYFREYGDRIGIGAYEHRPLPITPEELTSTAEMQETGQHPAMRELTKEHFDYAWEELQELVPATRGSAIRDGFNGLFSFTPDGGPMMGPSPAIDGAWIAQAVWVTQSAGVAQVMADWITTGDPGIATHELDIARFDQQVLSEQLVRERGAEAYDEVYDIHFRGQPTAVARDLRTSPFHLRLAQAGAHFAESNGWERAQWCDANAPLLAELGDRSGAAFRQDPWDALNYSKIAAAEAWATRNRAAMYDMTSLARVQVSGPGATEYLERLCSAKVGRAVGAVTYTLMLDERGGILSDVTVARLGEERYLLGTNGYLDLDRLQRLAPRDGSVQVLDLTDGTCCIGLWGPRARDIVAPLAEADVSDEAFGYFRAREFFLAGVPVVALRVSYVGELGWEISTRASHGLRLWDELARAGAQHGLVPAGRLAFNSLRLEKGYRSYGTDMTREDSPEGAGVGFAVSRRTLGFIGEGQVPAGAEGRRLVTVQMRTETGVPDAGSPVLLPGGGAACGWVTSADHSYTTGTILAYAWVPSAHAEVGEGLEVMRFGRRIPARVVADPVVDPEGAKIRC